MTRKRKTEMLIEMLQPKHEHAINACKGMAIDLDDDTVEKVYEKWKAGEYKENQFDVFWALHGWL